MTDHMLINRPGFGVLDAFRASSSIEGWLSVNEGILLWRLARSGRGRGGIIEIGSWKGKSTIWLAYGSRSANREKVVAVDPHSGSREHKERLGTVNTRNGFLNNLRLYGVYDWVTPMVERSEELARRWTEEIRLVFIDGSHDYEDVKKDFLLWFERLGISGVIALHDSYLVEGGPERVVEELVLRSRYVAHVGFVGSITFFEKRYQSILQRMRNHLLLLVFRVFKRIGGFGKPQVRFWLSLLLAPTDSSASTIFWVLWQALFRCRRITA